MPGTFNLLKHVYATGVLPDGIVLTKDQVEECAGCDLVDDLVTDQGDGALRKAGEELPKESKDSIPNVRQVFTTGESNPTGGRTP